MPDDPAATELDLSDPLVALFVRSRQVSDRLMQQTAALDRAWRDGNVADVIEQMHAEAQAEVDRMTKAAEAESR